jgi:hypothetical protein
MKNLMICNSSTNIILVNNQGGCDGHMGRACDKYGGEEKCI